MKKILIISYFFPPSAKAGAHRAYSMAEFLPEFGWQPIFIAPTKGYYGRIPRYDNKLLELTDKFPTYRIPFFYPFNNSSKDIIAKGSRKIWEKIFIPDTKILWNYSIKKRISTIVEKHNPQVIFITGTPFSQFLLAPYLKRKFNVPVILDYRDPWMGNAIHHETNIVKRKLHYYLEKKAVEATDLLTTASYYIIDYIKEHSGDYVNNKDFFGFPYGFNLQKLSEIKGEEKTDSQRIIGTFAGFVHGDIDIHEILVGIKTALWKNKQLAKNISITCLGTLFGYSQKPAVLLNKYNIDKIVHLEGFKPYNEFLDTLKGSDFLILPHGSSPLAQVLYPTKFFDYLGVKKPILYWGEKGQVWDTIMKCDAGICSQPSSKHIADSLVEIFQQRKSFYSNDEYLQFARRNIFRDFTHKLNQFV
jgi:hypothetical protein